jgi:phytoene desaturase
MPDIFEKFYNDFGHTTSDFYKLKRIDPSYKIFWDDNTSTNVPANYNELKSLFESIEKGSGDKLEKYLDDAKIKYEVGMGEFVERPSLSITEYLDPKLIVNSFKLDLLSSISTSIGKKFKNQKLRQLLEFPVLFLGAKPTNTPALYSMMNYADIKLGTWYPMGGMYEIAKAFTSIAEKQGVKIVLNQPVEKVIIRNGEISEVKTNKDKYEVDAVINTADYHHFEQVLLGDNYSKYNERYWESRVFAPTCLLFYLGINKTIKGIEHHNLFFDTDFDQHSEDIYDTHKWPKEPLFYLSATSKTDETAPLDCENLFILIPLSTEIEETEVIIENYYEMVIDRIEKRIGQNIKENIIYKKVFSRKDFISDYNSYKGNAYGLANTLLQTGFLKPKMKNDNIRNLYYAGQLTVPGPGLPPSILSGKIAAQLLHKEDQ